MSLVAPLEMPAAASLDAHYILSDTDEYSIVHRQPYSPLFLLQTDLLSALKNKNVTNLRLLLDDGLATDFLLSVERSGRAEQHGGVPSHLCTTTRASSGGSMPSFFRFHAGDRIPLLVSELTHSHSAAPLNTRFGRGRDDEAVLRLLLARGCNVDARSSISCLGALFGAVKRAPASPSVPTNVALLRLLLDHGADVSANVGGGAGAFAIFANHMAHFTMLLDSGMDPDDRFWGVPLLFFAVCFKAMPFIKALLENGADPSISFTCSSATRNGDPPLHDLFKDWEAFSLLEIGDVVRVNLRTMSFINVSKYEPLGT